MLRSIDCLELGFKYPLLTIVKRFFAALYQVFMNQGYFNKSFPAIANYCPQLS